VQAFLLNIAQLWRELPHTAATARFACGRSTGKALILMDFRRRDPGFRRVAKVLGEQSHHDMGRPPQSYGVTSDGVTALCDWPNWNCKSQVLATGWPLTFAGVNFQFCAAVRAWLAK